MMAGAAGPDARRRPRECCTSIPASPSKQDVSPRTRGPWRRSSPGGWCVRVGVEGAARFPRAASWRADRFRTSGHGHRPRV